MANLSDSIFVWSVRLLIILRICPDLPMLELLSNLTEKYSLALNQSKTNGICHLESTTSDVP